MQVPICEINAADLEKHFIWCVRLCFKCAEEISFDLTRILTGVWCHSLFPKTLDYSFFLTEHQFHDRQKVYEAGLEPFTGPRIKATEDSRRRSFGKLPFDKRDLVLITGSAFAQLSK